MATERTGNHPPTYSFGRGLFSCFLGSAGKVEQKPALTIDANTEDGSNGAPAPWWQLQSGVLCVWTPVCPQWGGVDDYKYYKKQISKCTRCELQHSKPPFNCGILAGMFSSRTSINSAVDPFVPVEMTRMDPLPQTPTLRFRSPRKVQGLVLSLSQRKCQVAARRYRVAGNVPRLRPLAWTRQADAALTGGAPRRTRFNPEQHAP